MSHQPGNRSSIRNRQGRPAAKGGHGPKRLLIVGCGDVGLRVLRLLDQRWQVYALSSSPARFADLRQHGAIPLFGNLDDPASLRRLAGLADLVLHLAPPNSHGTTDQRTRHLLQALSQGRAPEVLVYGSTTGIYGDAQGALLDETRSPAPRTDRARRRLSAEQALRAYGRRTGVALSILRIPGIYASDRDGGHPRERLQKGAPVLQADQDVYTNHIHADDLARACVAALHRAWRQRVFHICDDSQMTMGEYFDLAADLCGLARPPRISREQAAQMLSPMQLSFWGESRRLSNARMKRDLRLRLRYPHPAQGLLA